MLIKYKLRNSEKQEEKASPIVPNIHTCSYPFSMFFFKFKLCLMQDECSGGI